MSLWNDFLDNIAKPVTNAVVDGANYWKDAFTGNLGSPSQFISNKVTSAGVEIGAGKQLTNLGIEEKAQQVIKDNLKYTAKNQATSNDIVLQAGVKLHDEIISPYITRPISTIGLLTDLNSPLYTSNEFEKGFQVNDIAKAYKRSEEVSLGQAFTKSDLTPLKNVSDLVFKAGGIDLDTVDLWDDKDIKRAFVDNTVGKYFTGGLDFIGSNIATSVAFGGISRVGYLGARKAGLSTRNKAMAQYEQDINDGLAFDQQMPSGRYTNSGNDILRMAKSTDINEVEQLVKQYSNNADLIGPIHRATNPQTVRDLILADKGYFPALDRLSKNAPADLYEIANMNAVVKAKFVEEGKLPQFDDKSWERMNAAFDDAINRVPEYRFIRDALLDPQTKTPTVLGKPYMPAEPVFGREALGRAREKISKTRVAATTRDFSTLGHFDERTLGTSLNGPTTKIVRMVGTEKPLGFITYSGARPFDGLKEIDAFFDDFDLFRDGSNMIAISPNKKITAAEFRNNIKREFAGAETNIARDAVLDKLDDQIGLVLAYSNGFFDTAKIKAFSTAIKNSIRESVDPIAKKGYAMDATGSRTLTDPWTQSQLIESRRLAPWNFVEKEFLNALKNSKTEITANAAADAMKGVFETFNKYWTIDVLARPSYIPKNSLFEPALSATLAHGMDYTIGLVPTMTKNFIKNTKNRALSTASKVLNKAEYKAVNQAVEDLTTQLDKAVTQLDSYVAEVDLYLNPELYDIKLSPVTSATHKARVVEQLKAAEKLVDDIELELRDAISPFGTMSKIPTIASLERRIAYLRKNFSDEELNALVKGDKTKVVPSKTVSKRVERAYQAQGSRLASAELSIIEAKKALQTLAPDTVELLEANRNIALQYQAIDDILQKLGPERVKQADVFGKSAEYKKRYYGKPQQYRVIQNQYMPVQSLFDEQQMGKAMMEEFGNTRTVAAGYLNELTIGVRQGMIHRRGPATTTYVNDPRYFEELAYFVNRSMRNDPLVKMVLAEIPEADILKWATSDAGTSYFKQFGTVTEGTIPQVVRERVGRVQQYLPSKDARALVLSKDATSVELQKMLSSNLRDLSPIHPLDFDIHTASEFGVRTVGQIEKSLNKGASWIFSKLASPENPIRWASADQFFADSIARKANALAEQGYSFVKKDGTFDIDRLNSLRKAATREALEQNEKTFYTVRRQNRALYAARVATSFPTASLNAFYRYGRFTLNNTKRVAQFLNVYQSAFRSFGVDQYGNPTDDPLKATHLIVPGTDDMGFFGGKGIRLNARGIGFLLNYPTPSVYGSVLTAKVYQWQPGAEDLMKQWLGSTYDIVFPYGPQTSVGMAVTPRWANDLYNYAVGPEGKKDFLDSYKDVHNYYRTLDEMGVLKYPGDAAVKRATQNQFLVKFGWSFNSMFGVPAKTDTRPMQIYVDAYGLLVNKYKAKGASTEEAKALAGSEFTAKMGADFPIDRVTFKGSTSNAYIQPTSKAYSRVFDENTKLAESLADLAPELVGLLTLDLDENPKDFNLSVYRLLQDPDTKLPGGKLLNDVQITPQEEEKRRGINRVWSYYNTVTDALEARAIATDGKSLRSHPELLEARRKVAETVFRKESEQWWTEYNDPQRGDKAFRYAYGLNKIISDPDFMKKYGKTKLWSDVSDYMSIRSGIVSVYQSLPDRDSRKSIIKKNYNAVIDQMLPRWHPKLQEIIKRYFEEDTMKDATQKETK